MVKWITVEEAAARTGFKPRTIQRYAKIGYIKGRKYGRDWRIDPKSIIDLKPLPNGRPPIIEGE